MDSSEHEPRARVSQDPAVGARPGAEADGGAGADSDMLLFRPADVARHISISRSRCYELISEGRLPAIRLGKSVRISARQLEEFIRQLETEHVVVRQQPEEGGAE